MVRIVTVRLVDHVPNRLSKQIIPKMLEIDGSSFCNEDIWSLCKRFSCHAAGCCDIVEIMDAFDVAY